MTYKLIEMAAIFAAILTLIAGFSVVYKPVRKLLSRLEALENELDKHQAEMATSKDARAVLLGGVLACLEGLQEQGCNGSVVETSVVIRQFLIAQTRK
ncbi:MAG: hypothetical protein FWE06_00140 [Oscillospiraceae bacterium]|nr:hypothetical protein [Oscillospiraceae bacterium]